MDEEISSVLKRTHIPTGDTPGKSEGKYGRVAKAESVNKSVNKSHVTERQTARSLFQDDNKCLLPKESSHSVKVSNWKTEELEAVVQYVALYKPNCEDDKWPAIKDSMFWEQCAKAVHEYSGQPLRTGNI